TAPPTPRASSDASTASGAGCARRRRPRSPRSRRSTCPPSGSRTATAPPAPPAWCPRTSWSTRSASRRRHWPASSGRRCRRSARSRPAWRGTSCCSCTSTCSCSATCRRRRDEPRVVAVTVRERVALAPHTTLGVGGPARWFVEATDEATLREALAWSRARGVALRMLGGGSNVVVADAGFAYRDSAFKSREPGRYVVLAVTYRLRPGAAPTLGYADVERAVAARGLTAPTLADVRASVLAIRRTKSMVLDPGDPNRRS